MNPIMEKLRKDLAGGDSIDMLLLVMLAAMTFAISIGSVIGSVLGSLALVVLFLRWLL